MGTIHGGTRALAVAGLLTLITMLALAPAARCDPIQPGMIADALAELAARALLILGIFCALEIAIVAAEAATHSLVLGLNTGRAVASSLLANIVSIAAGVLLWGYVADAWAGANWAPALAGLLVAIAIEPVVVAVLNLRYAARTRLMVVALAVNVCTYVTGTAIFGAALRAFGLWAPTWAMLGARMRSAIRPDTADGEERQNGLDT